MTLLMVVLVISLLAWMVIAMCRMHMNRQVILDEDLSRVAAAPSTWMLARGTYGRL